MDNADHILIVEDDKDLSNIVASYLSKSGYKVTIANNGEQARSAVNTGINLIILDLELPDTTGKELCKEFRAQYLIPIIVLTGDKDDFEKVVLLELGADNYLQKPIKPRVLLSYIQATLRRAQPAADLSSSEKVLSEHELFYFDNYILNVSTRVLTKKDGENIIITAGEYDLLKVLLDRPEIVLSRDQLLEYTNGDIDSFDRSVDVLISRLRKKLEKEPKSPEIIKTIRGGGYMLNVSVLKGKAT